MDALTTNSNIQSMVAGDGRRGHQAYVLLRLDINADAIADFAAHF